ncbi:BBS1-like protein [Mya arenaria]|uniref:BBS1-like protein n=1 Tax=Mya arenaria TaxID=6604 RepID=A0ABY7FFF4_MYAAR|nr:BBS1-like protein [Mya arenaria]
MSAIVKIMSTVDLVKQPLETKGEPKSSKWLDAYHDPVASLYTFTQCITLSDIQADGDWKLIIADLGTGSFNMKLKVYKGTDLLSENTIIDLPTGVVTFYMDTHEPRTPAIAVASGPFIYIYKNLKPYFKFTLPPLEGRMNVFVLREMLEGMRSDGSTLTVRSLRYLQLTDPGDMSQFFEVYKNTPLKRQTVITCLNTLKKSMADEDAISCLVLGTEDKSIYVLDPEAFTVLATMSLPSVPVFLSVTGMFDVEYRIVGKKMWTVKLPKAITTIEVVDYKPKGFKAVLVALASGEVHVFKEKYLVDIIKVDDVVTAMRFGRFGREDGALIMVTQSGGLMIKILKRTAVFEEKDLSGGPPAAQNIKLNVPKKTKLFVDQTLRERENAVPMLVPGLNYAFETYIECLNDKGISDTVKKQA